MATVYSLVPDLDNFQYIIPDDAAAAMAFDYDGNAIGGEWRPPSVYRANPQKPKPDIWGFMSFGAVIGLSVPAAQTLCTFVDQSCELLLLELEGESMFLCNVISVVNALDRQKCRHRKGDLDWIDQFAFHPDRFEYSLFKIPETVREDIYCVEGLADPDDEFKGAVEKHGLRGLKFKELWTG
jgi:hypothetical protein